MGVEVQIKLNNLPAHLPHCLTARLTNLCKLLKSLLIYRAESYQYEK